MCTTVSSTCRSDTRLRSACLLTSMRFTVVALGALVPSPYVSHFSISRTSKDNDTNNSHRTVTVPASPPRRSWSSLPPRARPSTRPSPRSASSDCKAGTTSKTPTPLSLPLPLPLPLLATEAQRKLLRPPPPSSSRHPPSPNPEMRTRAKVHVACRSSAPSHSDTYTFY